MPKAPATSTANREVPLPETYEAAQQELEALVLRLESGQMPLDELLQGYQRGAALLAFCRERLQAIESQIQQLENAPSGAQP